MNITLTCYLNQNAEFFECSLTLKIMNITMLIRENLYNAASKLQSHFNFNVMCTVKLFNYSFFFSFYDQM